MPSLLSSLSLSLSLLGSWVPSPFLVFSLEGRLYLPRSTVLFPSSFQKLFSNTRLNDRSFTRIPNQHRQQEWRWDCLCGTISSALDPYSRHRGTWFKQENTHKGPHTITVYLGSRVSSSFDQWCLFLVSEFQLDSSQTFFVACYHLRDRSISE